MILDTHVWFWFVTGSKELSKKNADKIERAASSVKIPVIVYWEFLILAEKGRVRLRRSAQDFIVRAESTFPFITEVMTKDIILASRTLDFKHEDPADRFIAATAHVLAEPLVTRDRNLLELKWLKTLAV